MLARQTAIIDELQASENLSQKRWIPKIVLRSLQIGMHTYTHFS